MASHEDTLQRVLRQIAADPTNRDAILWVCGRIAGEGTHDPRAEQVAAAWQHLYPEHRAPGTLEAALAAALLRLADQAAAAAKQPQTEAPL